MATPRRSRRALVLVVLVLAGIAGAYAYFSGALRPLPEFTEYRTADFSFSYPRELRLREYSRGVVTLFDRDGEEAQPLAEVATYREDPESAVPPTFVAFITQQAQNLCGADNGVESVTCSDVVVRPYVSPRGHIGHELSMTLTRRSIAAGTTTVGAFAPIYAFDLANGAPMVDEGQRYSALFVYPSLSAVLAGTATPELLAKVMDTLVAPQVPILAESLATTTPAVP